MSKKDCSPCFRSVLTPFLCALICLPALVRAGENAPPNFVPELSLSYVDPQSGEQVSCGEGCRRLSVPAGVELEVHLKVRNMAGDPWPNGVPWDLWFDQPMHPFPGADIAACRDGENGPVDLDCWQTLMERVDRAPWKELVADRVCVPEEPGACREVTITVPMNQDFEGSRGRGVYSFAAWVDRFRTTLESDEFDNFAGPIRVRVREPLGPAPSGSAAGAESGTGAVVTSSSPKPYVVHILPAHAETSFSLSSMRSRASLEFSPAYNGEVSVEVEVTEAPEKIAVEIRKVSTGIVLAEGGGRTRVQIEGVLGGVDLKDDRRLEVVVRLAQGSRGSRGTIKVTFPERAVFRRIE